jgi:hypothetical protein
MLTSLFFVVAGFLEFAFVLQLHRQNEKEAIHKNRTEKITRNGQLTVTNEPQKENLENMSNMNVISSDEEQQFNIRKIDFIAFVVGLLLFLLFNLFYWLTFSLYKFN